jgi:DNA-binding response OmpR family regulator
MNIQENSGVVKIILVIEDDISILRGLKDNLIFEGYKVLTSSDGREGLQMAIENEINMLLLDIMLPGINGYDICRRLKKEKPDLPIIMITARGTEIDKIRGLDFGADDYMTKPFSIPELLARVRAIFRRSLNSTKDIDKYSFGNVALDFKKFKAFVNNEEIKLSSREFAVIKYLIEHEGEVIHRHDLLDKVWGHDVTPSTRTVDNYILDLRKKFEKDPANPKYIIGIRGAGYKFEL